MNAPRNEDLREAGRRRRDAALNDLLGYMNSVHRARRLRRRSAATALLLALGAGILFLALPTKRSDHTIAPIAIDDAPMDSSDLAEVDSPSAPEPLRIDGPEPVNIVVVRSDPSIVERYRADVTEYTHIRVHHLSDEELLRELAAMGRPTGMISMGGKTWLTEDVTDDWPSNESSPWLNRGL